MRTAYGMIKDAEEKGLLKENSTIIEPTSGNTGIALSMLGRLKGYKVIIVMPETMSDERKNEIKSYGAKLILTPGNEGMKGSINKVESIVKENNDYVYLDQFRNPANPGIHYETTAKEIIDNIKKNIKNWRKIATKAAKMCRQHALGYQIQRFDPIERG
jgi:cysteine synthase A